MNAAVMAKSPGGVRTSLESQQRAEWQSLQSRIRDLGEPVRFAIDLLPLPRALDHPRFGAGVLSLLRECYRSAHGGGDRECHGCCRRWTGERTFGAVGIVEFLNVDGAGLVGLCRECWGRPDRIQIALQGFQRDFGLASIEVAPVHEGGRA